jgi:hypothetical protein
MSRLMLKLVMKRLDYGEIKDEVTHDTPSPLVGPHYCFSFVWNLYGDYVLNRTQTVAFILGTGELGAWWSSHHW